MTWSAAEYRKFEDERTRPAADLIARIHDATVGRAVDLGCGPGNSTELIVDRYPGAHVVGIDSAPDMIDAARARLPDVEFALADLAIPATWPSRGPFDLIFANAALQWVPGHETLLPRLMDELGPGGHLAVQVPDNLDEPTHALMREVAAAGPWASALANASDSRAPRHSADWYYRALRPPAVHVEIWRTTYYHPLAGGPHAVVQWFSSTGLRPFLAPLDAEQRVAYLAAYERGIARAYPALPDGSVLLPTPRLFFVATRAR